MTPKDAQNTFNIEFQKRLKETVFPDELLQKGDACLGITGFREWKNATLHFESPMSMAMSLEEFKTVHNKDSCFTLFEIAQVVNSLEKKTYMQLNKTNCADCFEEYIAILESVLAIGNKWQEVVKPIRESIDNKIMIMANNVGGMRNPKLIKA